MSFNGKVEWFDFPVTSFDQSKAFFGELAGWKIEAMDENYAMIKAGEEVIGGLRRSDKVDPGSEGTVLYITVDDLPAAINRARTLKAQLLGEVVQVEGAGSFQLFKDLDGNTLALWVHSQ